MEIVGKFGKKLKNLLKNLFFKQKVTYYVTSYRLNQKIQKKNPTKISNLIQSHKYENKTVNGYGTYTNQHKWNVLSIVT